MRPALLFAPLLLSLTIAGAAMAQTQAPAAPRPADVASPEAITAALYDVISGPKGQPRDWARFKSLFAEGARLTPMNAQPDGTFAMHPLTPDEFAARAEKRLVEEGFHETEVHRVVERFGPVVHVFSTYDGRREGDAKPFVRGVNSIQLLNDGKRWYVANITWSPETKDLQLPAKYLPKK